MDRFVADLIEYCADGMRPDLLDDIRHRGASRSLARLQGRLPVLVLDQFEEFLREADNAGRQATVAALFRWIQRVTSVYGDKMRILISLRSDMYTRVEPLLKLVNSYLSRTIRLVPIADGEAVRELIAGAWSRTEESMMAVDLTADLQERLYREWEDARDEPEALFNLQARLYALFWSARERESGDAKQVEIGTAAEADVLSSHPDTIGSHTNYIAASFARTFEVKLLHCEAALEAVQDGFDAEEAWVPVTALSRMARGHIRRVAEHLSAESFKERRDLFDLLRLAQPQALERLCARAEARTDSASDLKGVCALTEEEARKALWCLWDDKALGDKALGGNSLLALPSEEVLARIGLMAPHLVSADLVELDTPIDCLPWEDDPDDNSSGAVLGLPDAITLVEYLRTYLLAVLWLTETSICRVSRNRIHLIHDRLGAALRAWARESADTDPLTSLASLTARSGDRCHWDMSAEVADEDLPTDWNRWRDDGMGLLQPVDDPIYANARLRSCLVTDVYFRNIVFLNCDYQMTRFSHCVFENVQFINCVMDGVMLDKCVIRGRPDPVKLKGVLSREQAERVSTGRMPRFYSDQSPLTVDDLRYFRRSEAGNGLVLFSVASGMPIIAIDLQQAIAAQAAQIDDFNGGLTLLGGRLSNITSTSCTFDDDDAGHPGTIALAYAAGSSVDFVEHDQLSLVIVGCALHGLTICRPLRATATPVKAMRVEVEESQLSGPWFGHGLVGTAVFRDSTIWGEAVLSDDFQLSGVVRAEVSLPGLTDQARRERDRQWAALYQKTDFRSQPARYELLEGG